VPDVADRIKAAIADRYAIEREIGRGGMATVYLAQDLRHHRPVAVKVLHPEIAGALGPERFLSEIRIAASLQHPHLLPLLDSGEADGFLYYVMPYIEGKSLRERLNREKQLPLEDAVQIAGEIARALDYAHRRNVLHRDVKPENILLQEGHAVVADFGIARAIVTAGGDTLTATGVTVGTPSYMSPEQAAGERQLDGRSDLYSLGCVLYEMLAGQPPFSGPTVESVLHQHLTADPAPVRQLRRSVPQALVETLARALAKTPADRFATAAQFAAALDAALQPPPLSLSRSLRHRIGQVAAVAVVAALASGVFFIVTRSRSAAGAVTPSASTIAVMPFVPVTADTALARLGRELVVTLSANLEGVGGIHAAEAITVLAQMQEGEPLTPAAETELARRLGARSVLRGTLVPVGNDVRLDATLYDVDSLAALAHASVTGRADDVARLTDAVTLALLRQVWQHGEPPAPDLAAITTRSVPALRAYLEGEQALARAEFDVAVNAFERAFAADSTFWFAYWRSLYPRSYEGSTADSATVARLIAHRHEFPTPDRLIIEATFLAPTLSAQLATWRDVTRRFPNYWPAWYDYGNCLVHLTPYLGTTLDDSRAALERTVALNPRFAPAWEHLSWTVTSQGDTAEVARTVRALASFATAKGFRINPSLMGLYTAVNSVLANGGDWPPALLRRDAQFVIDTHSAEPNDYLGIAFLVAGFPRAQVQFNDAILALRPNRALQTVMWLGKGFAYAARGDWDSSGVAMDHWRRLVVDSTASLSVYGLAVAGASLGSVATRQAATWRPVQLPTWPEGRAELAWLDGILAHLDRDAAALARARRQVQESGSLYTDLLERSLAAFAADLDGDPRAAGRALATLEWESAEHIRHFGYGRHHPFFNSMNRLAATGWLLAAGDSAQAARLLRWHEAVFWELHRYLYPANLVFAAPALFERARIEEAAGDTSAALIDYRAFVERYDLARGAWAARVEQTTRKLAPPRRP
jgi:tRNA A-37 threonylcarbamoyl transferase component Bud32/TolB-like protein/tetratricopeptide (TPR) repeat protein